MILREEAEDIRVPANIAGSAANPDEGGRPTTGEEDDITEDAEKKAVFWHMFFAEHGLPESTEHY